MQTSFSPAQLANPDIAAADRILRSCVHCGFCTATCPTYVIAGDENDSPRGRIYLIKEMLERGERADETVARHVDRCLTCLSCMTTCPSGVDYMHLVDLARVRVASEFRRPAAERMLRAMLAAVLPRPALFRAALALAGLARACGLQDIMPGRLRTLMGLMPASLPRPSAIGTPGFYPPDGARRGRVGLLAGCAQSVLDPGINAAAIRLLNRLGFEVVVAEGAGCCGALAQHMGEEGQARETARRTVRSWEREISGRGLEAIIVTTSGCGTAIKDYGHLFRADPDREIASLVASRTRDISEFLAMAGPLPVAGRGAGLRVAYHAACSLQHAQRIREAPPALLRQAGFDVLDIADAHLCCGSAGTYNLLQPEFAEELRRRKLGNIGKTGADVVAAGNIGCLRQLAGGLAMPVLHTVELLDWACGGPEPEAMRKDR